MRGNSIAPSTDANSPRPAMQPSCLSGRLHLACAGNVRQSATLAGAARAIYTALLPQNILRAELFREKIRDGTPSGYCHIHWCGRVSLGADSPRARELRHNIMNTGAFTQKIPRLDKTVPSARCASVLVIVDVAWPRGVNSM